jgi:hypothetical protein
MVHERKSENGRLLFNFERGQIVGTHLVGVSISQTATLLHFSTKLFDVNFSNPTSGVGSATTAKHLITESNAQAGKQ